MWSIENPLRLFEDLCALEYGNKLNLFALMRKEKYLSFPKEDIKDLENNKNISVRDVKVRDPNNPAKLIESKFITYKQK